jgi:hypothetical protein
MTLSCSSWSKEYIGILFASLAYIDKPAYRPVIHIPWFGYKQYNDSWITCHMKLTTTMELEIIKLQN